VVKLLQLLAAAFAVALAVYLGAWFAGSINGNLGQVLGAVALVSGVYWLAEHIFFKPRRRQLADVLVQAMAADRPDGEQRAFRAIVMERPWWLHASTLFPLVAALLLVRACLWEPLKIPSSAMSPTLRVGDLALVSKYAYGVRMPWLDYKLTEGDAPQRGDVVSFRAPLQPRRDTVKRIVGLPGDEVAYLGKRLTINGRRAPLVYAGDFYSRRAAHHFSLFEEQLGMRRHRVIHDEKRSGLERGSTDFPLKENCTYLAEGIVCKVPPGQYFVMADNRDFGQDSRLWGFVPGKNIAGKVFFVWMNFENLDQIGQIR
jgi:signal peptidase I